MNEIRKKRNNAVHPGEGYNYKSDALDCLQNIIDVLNAYSASQKQAIKQAHEERSNNENYDEETIWSIIENFKYKRNLILTNSYNK